MHARAWLIGPEKSKPAGLDTDNVTFVVRSTWKEQAKAIPACRSGWLRRRKVSRFQARTLKSLQQTKPPLAACVQLVWQSRLSFTAELLDQWQFR